MKRRFTAVTALALVGAVSLAAGSVLADTANYKVEDEAINASLTGKPGDPVNGKKYS